MGCRSPTYDRRPCRATGSILRSPLLDPDRLRDELGDRSRNASRVRLDAFARRAAASVPPGARVLDAGAGEGAYRAHFAQTRYEAADFQQVDKPYGQLDYVCDVDSIPVEDERYDLVLCTQVLEHLPEPADVLTELHRVLRAGGTLWLTRPRCTSRSTSSHTTSIATRRSVWSTDSPGPGSCWTLSIGLRDTSALCRFSLRLPLARYLAGQRHTVEERSASSVPRPRAWRARLQRSRPDDKPPRAAASVHRVAGPSEELRGRRRAAFTLVAADVGEPQPRHTRRHDIWRDVRNLRRRRSSGDRRGGMDRVDRRAQRKNRDRFRVPPDDRLLIASFSTMRRALDRARGASYPGRFAEALADRAASIGARVVHAHFGWSALYALPLAKAIGLPLVCTFHASDVTVFPEPTTAFQRPSQPYIRGAVRLHVRSNRCLAIYSQCAC